jgi:sugar phosphate isomerase/epimerase
MTLAIGLNPYGLTYALGLQGNPDGTGLEGFLQIAEEIGARVVELHQPWLDGVDLAALRRRLEGVTPVVSCGLDPAGDDAAVESAVALGASVVRMALTRVLQGDRHAVDWPRLVDGVRARLARVAPRAAAAGLSVAIENHQDFTSADLMELCEEAGEAVGIALDTGNAFAVGEAPLEFARTVAPRTRHMHLKDYRVQPTDEGYRLVRCAIGDGAVPFPELLQILGGDLTASLEPGALEARHIRLFTEEWWRGYPPVDARRLAAALRAARVNRLGEDEDHRTPWERGDTGNELIRYERDMMRRSVANLRALGLME